MKDDKERTCQPFDMSVPIERNTSIEKKEELSKYSDVKTQVAKMWGMKTTKIKSGMRCMLLVSKGWKNTRLFLW